MDIWLTFDNHWLTLDWYLRIWLTCDCHLTIRLTFDNLTDIWLTHDKHMMMRKCSHTMMFIVQSPCLLRLWPCNLRQWKPREYQLQFSIVNSVSVSIICHHMSLLFLLGIVDPSQKKQMKKNKKNKKKQITHLKTKIMIFYVFLRFIMF